MKIQKFELEGERIVCGERVVFLLSNATEKEINDTIQMLNRQQHTDNVKLVLADIKKTLNHPKSPIKIIE